MTTSITKTDDQLRVDVEAELDWEPSGSRACGGRERNRSHLTHERTDSDIAGHVANVLEWSSPIPRGRVNAEVEKGWVTLRGEVDHDYQRRAVEHLMRHVGGVRGITNTITVKPRANPIDVKARIENSSR
jgi:hypothetical protein